MSALIASFPLPDRKARCRLCDAQLSTTFVDLRKSPLCETFLSESELDRMEPFYPLHAYVCNECWLVQLKQYLEPDRIFTNSYPYYSSYSTSWVEHCKRYCEEITPRLALGGDDLVVEIGCNDGYLLENFPRLGVNVVLGIEPCENVAREARSKGLPVLVEFFSSQMARRLLTEYGPAKLVIGNNVLAHVPDLRDFVTGVATLLDEDGVATFEFPHFLQLMRQTQFDTIYHEHFCYFSALAIQTMAAAHGLVLFDVDELPTHGGSLRIYLAKQNRRDAPSPSVLRVIEEERAAGLARAETYTGFQHSVDAVKLELLSFLIDAKRRNKTVVGYGAPGKGNTLLNYCGIGRDLLAFTVDRNPHKHGRYTPGTHIPIRPVEAIDEEKPDYLLILPWNLSAEISAQMAHVREWGCRFVRPIPKTEIF